jgi:hypothetical protein
MHFKEISMLTNNAMLIISGRDTTSPIGIQFRPFIYNVCATKYHKGCTTIHVFIGHANDRF